VVYILKGPRGTPCEVKSPSPQGFWGKTGKTVVALFVARVPNGNPGIQSGKGFFPNLGNNLKLTDGS